MSGPARAWSIAGAIGAVLAIGAVVGWLNTRKTGQGEQTSVPQVSSSDPSATNRVPFFPLNPRLGPGGSSSNQIGSPGAGSDTNLVADWADKLDDILSSNSEESDKAKQL